MFLSQLHLEHFRNYRELDLCFSAPVTLVQGRNGQGKTNLLEAGLLSGDEQVAPCADGAGGGGQGGGG